MSVQSLAPAVRQGIVLFGHGARDPQWAGPMQRCAERLRADAPAVAVTLAFMEFLSPGLDEAVAQLAEAGVTQVAVVPVFLAQGGHLKRDVPAQVAAVQARFPGLALRLQPAVGEDDRVIAAIAHVARAALSARD